MGKTVKTPEKYAEPAPAADNGFDVTEDLQEVHKESFVLSSLKEEDVSVTLSQSSDILRINKSFYAGLYDIKATDSTASQLFLSSNTEVLDNSMQDQLLSLDELTKVLESFEKNKTPGSDGLPAELYSAMWDLIGQGLLEMYDSMHLASTMCESMRKGIITLIYKQKGEREELAIWRLILLLNVDYKILSKVIANWTRSALGSTIHPEQTCAVLGRMIAESLMLLRDTIANVQDRVKDMSLRGATIPGSGGLQVKASLHMDDFAVFCSDPLSVSRLMSICDQFERASGARVNRGKRSLEKNAVVFIKVYTKQLRDTGLCALCLLPGKHTETNINCTWRTINLVKDLLWAAQNLLVFQLKELTPTEYYRLAHSKVQDYILRDTRKLGAATAKNKELTSTKCCRLAHSKVQEYVLRDVLKLGEAATK
eukprot:g42782.t1